MPYQAARCHVIGLGSDAPASWISVVTVAVLTVGSSVGHQRCIGRMRFRGPNAGTRGPDEADEPDDPAALAAERFEQFEHTVVGGAGFTGQRPGDHVGKVVVADGDRVRIAERRPEHRADRPRPDATDQRQPGSGDDRCRRLPSPTDGARAQPPRSAPGPASSRCRADGTTMPGAGQGLRSGWESEPGERAWRGRAELETQPIATGDSASPLVMRWAMIVGSSSWYRPPLAPMTEAGVVAGRPGHDRVARRGDRRRRRRRLCRHRRGRAATPRHHPRPSASTSPRCQLMRSVPGPSGVNVARTNSCGVSHVVGSALPYRNGDNANCHRAGHRRRRCRERGMVMSRARPYQVRRMGPNRMSRRRPGDRHRRRRSQVGSRRAAGLIVSVTGTS